MIYQNDKLKIIDKASEVYTIRGLGWLILGD